MENINTPIKTLKSPETMKSLELFGNIKSGNVDRNKNTFELLTKQENTPN